MVDSKLKKHCRNETWPAKRLERSSAAKQYLKYTFRIDRTIQNCGVCSFSTISSWYRPGVDTSPKHTRLTLCIYYKRWFIADILQDR